MGKSAHVKPETWGGVCEREKKEGKQGEQIKYFMRKLFKNLWKHYKNVEIK